MTRRLITSELLCCVINNSTSIENDQFQEKMVEFYNYEELSAAKKQIFADFEATKGEKFKSQINGQSKSDKLKEIIELVKFILVNNFDKSMPQYCAVDFGRLAMLGFDCEKNRIDKIDARIKTIERTLNKMADERVLKHEQVNSNSIVSTAQPNCSRTKTTGVSWADRVKQNNLDDSEDEFLVVKRNKNRRETIISPKPKEEVLDKTQQNTDTTKSNKKVVICKGMNSQDLPVARRIIKKGVIYVGNLEENVEAKNIEEFVKSKNIEVFTTSKVMKRGLENTTGASNRSSSFRITIEDINLPTVLDPTFWPQDVLVRKWIFNPRINVEPPKNETHVAMAITRPESVDATATIKNGKLQ